MPRVILSENPYDEIHLGVSIIDRPTRTALAPSQARGGPDNSDLTERGIRGMFYEQLELGVRNIWALAAGLFFMSDTLTEKHRWLGQVPEPRKHFGGLNLTKLRNLGIDITNDDYEASVWWSKHDWRRDKTGHLARRIPELARSYLDHWNSLAVGIIEDNPNAYDGVAYFSTAHSVGDSGTMDNALVAGTLPALDVTDALRPTKDEALNILTGMAAHFFGFKDDQGRPANQAARDFLVVCPPPMAPGFISAVKDSLQSSGGSNELGNLGWNFIIVPEARLTDVNDLVMFRTDDKSSPALILQEEDTPTVEILAEGSEHWIKNNEAIGVAKASRAAGPGDFKKAIRGTLS